MTSGGALQPGTVVVYDYAAAAISCEHNGRRIRGTATIVGRDDEPGWLLLDIGVRVREDEIAMTGTHPFQPDERGYRCTVCGFTDAAQTHITQPVEGEAPYRATIEIDLFVGGDRSQERGRAWSVLDQLVKALEEKRTDDNGGFGIHHRFVRAELQRTRG